MPETNLAATTFTLYNTSYSPDIWNAAKRAQPGNIVTFENALEASIDVSCQSSKVFVQRDGEKYPDGPFGAIRMAVKATELFRILLNLRGASAKEVYEKIKNLEGRVVSIGHNCVNGARSKKGEVFSNPVAHGEMDAIIKAGMAVPFPVCKWPEKDICFVEATSSEDCDSCSSRNSLWSGTALTIAATTTLDVLKHTGFDEGEACKIDDRDPSLHHANIHDLASKNFGMSSVYTPHLREKAARAFAIYREHEAQIYQADYSKNIAAAMKN